jgi:hypothetical protein
MVLTLAPYISPQFLDNNGVPAAGYQLFSYLSGTSTKSDTYSDSTGTTNSNPIILDSSGRCVLYLDAHAYKFVLAGPDDTDPPSSPIWTQDVVGFVPSGTADVDREVTAGEAISSGELCYISQGDGSKTAGRWYLADADLQYASETAKALGFANSAMAIGETGTVRIVGSVSDLSSLTTGSVYYVSATAGEITASTTGLAYVRQVGIADSSTTLLMSPWLRDPSPVKDVDLTTVGNVGAGEDVLYTSSLDAGALYKSGMFVHVLAAGHYANNANAKTLKLHIDDGTNDTTLISASLTASEAGDWELGGVVYRNAAGTGKSAVQVLSGVGSSAASFAAADVQEPTVVWANAVEVRVTGEATDNDDVTIESAVVLVITP